MVNKSLCLAVLLISLSAQAGGEPTLNQADGLTALAASYGIEVVAVAPVFPIQTQHGVIDGKAAGDAERLIYAGLFVPEFSLYPVDLVRRVRLKRVVLCQDLAFGGQRRNAIPDYEHNTLYLDVARGAYNKIYLRKVIHHEFFHIVDLHDDGEVYKDARWVALNRPDFRYANGGQSVQDQPRTSVATAKLPGFLNHYSTTGVEEDKAEIFAYLFVDPVYLSDRAKLDPVLAAKVARMKAGLLEFCPKMDAAFWQKLASSSPRED